MAALNRVRIWQDATAGRPAPGLPQVREAPGISNPSPVIYGKPETGCGTNRVALHLWAGRFLHWLLLPCAGGRLSWPLRAA